MSLGGGGEIHKGGGGGGREDEIPRDLAPGGGEIPWDLAAGGGEITGGRNPWDTGKVYILLTVMNSSIFTV